VEGDDAPAAASSRAGLAAQLQELQTALVLGQAIISTTAAGAGRLLEVLEDGTTQNIMIQIRDEVSAPEAEVLKESVAALLDRGVAVVLLPVEAAKVNDFKTVVTGLPAERVGAAFSLPDVSSTDAVEMINSLNAAVGTYLITAEKDVPLVEGSADPKHPSPQASVVRDLAVSAVRQLANLAKAGRTRRMMLSLPQSRPSVPLVAKLEKMDIGLVLESTAIEFSNAKGTPTQQQTGKTMNFTDSFLGCLVTDRSDGLFATVVADEQGVALGLAYSSHESIGEAVQTRQGVYHSRSRGLWYKGLTSGATQVLYRIDVDCDKDALRFTVFQNEPGGFDHLLFSFDGWN